MMYDQATFISKLDCPGNWHLAEPDARQVNGIKSTRHRV